MSISLNTVPTDITIDSTHIPFSAVVEVVRSFAVLDGPNTGRTVSTGRLDRDVIGTFYNYSVTFDSRRLTKAQYETLYMLVSAPAESHTVSLPFNEGTLTMLAYCTQGEDKLFVVPRQSSGGRVVRARWGQLKINFIAVAAERT